jgi:pimeloyl-ACP methyl ester carboxylesterase
VTTVELRDVVLHGHRLVYRIGPVDQGADQGVDARSERPVLVLVHGLGGSSATWQEVLPGFADHYTVVAPDLFGHGESDKPRHDYSLGAHANVVRDLMIALGIERATVVGQSLGGGVAMQLAYQHPQRCERLVLVSSGGLGSEVSWILRALSLPGVEYLMPVLFPSFVRDAGNALSRRLRGLGLRAPRLAEEWRTYVSLTDPGNRQAFVRTLRAVVDPGGQAVSARDRLYLAAHVPTLIVWGRHDRMIPVEHAVTAHDAIPGSRLAIFEDSGHFPHAEEPRHFVDVVTDFVDTTEPNRLDEADWQARLASGAPA